MNSFATLLGGFFASPMMFALRGERWYWSFRVAAAITILLFSAVWLIAPFAIYSTMGLWWSALWLLPTTIAILALIFQPIGAGG